MVLKLLVSPRSPVEAVEALRGGADIIDCKNPAEGSLGACPPWVIQEIKDAIAAEDGESVELSATLGDLPALPGTAALAASGLAHVGVNYIKAGVHGPKTAEQARNLLEFIAKAALQVDDCVKVVAASYADYKRARIAIPPMDLVDIAGAAGCAVVMVDTAIKDGRGLRDFMTEEAISTFCERAAGAGMEVALAGNLKLGDFPFLKSAGATIIGVRSLVCTGGDRATGHVEADLVRRVKAAMA
jgi:hypothetical protein